MLGIDVGAPPLPERETRLEFIRRYAEDSGRRLERLRQTDEPWWEELDHLLRRAALEGLGDDAPADAHLPPPWPADGDAADARTRAAQQLRADRRHRRPDAESRADDLRVREPGGVARGERTGGAKAPLPGARSPRGSPSPSGRDAERERGPGPARSITTTRVATAADFPGRYGT